jgi:hypothetical protein
MGQSSTVHGVWLGVCRQPTPSQAIATEFCAFAASKQESIKAIIPNATAGGVRSRPFRASHLNIEDYVAAGYERETAKQYIDTLSMG